MRSRLAALLLVAALVAGCGGREGGGRASLWITRDRGERVVMVKAVPAGLTAMQALSRVADVKTRYGGRFVQSIEGVEGSLGARQDWFYFVNGIEADRSAAEYRLRPGDVEWWDLRSWRTSMEQPVVVGAFPEPFLHGFDGRRRPAHVRYTLPGQAPAARALGRLLHARSVARTTRAVPDDANVLLLAAGRPRFVATLRRPGAGSPVRFVFAGDAGRLARDPARVRYRYSLP